MFDKQKYVLKWWRCVEKEGCELKNTVAVGKRGQMIPKSREEGGTERICFCLSYSWTFIRGGFEGKCTFLCWSGPCFSHVSLGCMLCVHLWGHVRCHVCACGHAARAACERPAFHTSVTMPRVCRCILSNFLCMNVRTS